MEKIYKLVDNFQFEEALRLVEKNIESKAKVTAGQMQQLQFLHTYCSTYSGKIAQARSSFVPHLVTEKDFNHLRHIDLFPLFANFDFQAQFTLSPASVYDQYFQTGLYLFTRQFDKINQKFVLKSKPGYVEREEFSILLFRQFVRLLQNQPLESAQVYAGLQKVMAIDAKKPNVQSVMNQRLHRQHLDGIVCSVVQLLLMQPNQETIEQLKKNEAIVKIVEQVNPRLSLLLKFNSKEQIIEFLADQYQQTKHHELQVFLVKNHKLISQRQIEKLNCPILNLLSGKEAEIEETLPNLLLLFSLITQSKIQPSQIKNCAMLKKLFDPTIQLESGAEIPAPLQFALGLPCDLADYPFLAFLQHKNPRQYLKEIQVSNAQYFALPNEVYEAYLAEPLAAFQERSQQKLYSSFKLMNHTEDQQWEFPQVVQATVMNAYGVLTDNYCYAQESVLEACNVFGAVRLFESKALLNSYQVLFCFAVFSLFNLVSLESEKISVAAVKNCFEGSLRWAGEQSASNAFLFQLCNLEDQSVKYFNVQEQEEFTVQLEGDRKKCGKQILSQEVHKDKLFEFIQETPQLGKKIGAMQKKMLKVAVAVRILYQELFGVRDQGLVDLFGKLKENQWDEKFLAGEQAEQKAETVEEWLGEMLLKARQVVKQAK